MTGLFPATTLARLVRAGVNPNWDDPMLFARLIGDDYPKDLYAVRAFLQEPEGELTVSCFDPICLDGFWIRSLPCLERDMRLCQEHFEPVRLIERFPEWAEHEGEPDDFGS